LPGRAAAWNGTIRVRNVSRGFEPDPSWPDNVYFRQHGLEVLGDPALVEKVCRVLNG